MILKFSSVQFLTLLPEPWTELKVQFSHLPWTEPQFWFSSVQFRVRTRFTFLKRKEFRLGTWTELNFIKSSVQLSILVNLNLNFRFSLGLNQVHGVLELNFSITSWGSEENKGTSSQVLELTCQHAEEDELGGSQGHPAQLLYCGASWYKSIRNTRI